MTAEPAELACFSTKDGKKLWQRSQQYIDVFGKDEGERIEKNLALARDLGKEVSALHRERDAARKANDTNKQKNIDERINALRKRIAGLTLFPPMPGGDTANTGNTPTSDGKNVFAVFGTGIVSSHTLSGKRNWIKFIEACPYRKPHPSQFVVITRHFHRMFWLGRLLLSGCLAH